MHKYILALTLALAVNQAQANWFTGFGTAVSSAAVYVGDCVKQHSLLAKTVAIGAVVIGAIYFCSKHLDRMSEDRIARAKKASEAARDTNGADPHKFKRQSNPVSEEDVQDIADALKKQIGGGKNVK